MQLKIDRINHTGEGIAKKENITYFISKTIPEDIIEVKEENIIQHKNYKEVLDYKIIKQSQIKEEIPCPYYKECGGCQLMGLPYKYQLDYKKNKVIDIFKKYASIEINPQIQKTTPYSYRNKITLQVQNGKIGLYKEKTNIIIPIKKCLLIPENLNNIIKILENLNLDNIEKIILKTMQNNIMIQFIGTINKEEVLKKINNRVSSIYINNTLIYGLKYLKEKLSSYEFLVSPSSFFQINHEGTTLIYDKVKEYLGENNNEVLDLYCGTGTIGIYVSKNCNKITGIELNSSSASDAKRNIDINNIKNIEIKNGDVSKLLKADKKYDAIIVDPPRSGLDKLTIATLKKIKAKKIIYISCDPITLARDINNLKELYYIERINLIDMFPNTYHVECVSLLSLKTLEK